MRLLASVLLFCAPVVVSAEPRAVDLVVRNGTVVTIDPARRVIAGGAVAVDAGRIVGVGPAGEVDLAFRGRDVLDASGRIVIPGLLNAHGHPPMVTVRRVAYG